MNNISFPGLGLDFKINPVAIPFGNRGIYWYAIIIVTGFMLATAYGLKRAHKFGADKEKILDALLFAVPAAIICARAYYVIFEFEHYKDNLIEIFYIWNGGIAIYGAIIGAALAFFIYAKVTKTEVLPMFDIGALGLLIGQSIGRWGNFVNGEAYGVATNLPWRMVVNGVVAHPTFLYESLWNALGFVILHFYSKNRKFKGEIFLLYVAWYGLGRFFIEGLRTDSLFIANTGIRVSQMLAGVVFIVATVLLIILYKNGGKLKCQQK